MRVVIDIEANGLENPDQVWLVVCKDIDTGEYHIFRNVTSNEFELKRLRRYWDGLSCLIGHNLNDYDLPVLDACCNLRLDISKQVSVDTLILSKLIDYSRDGHSVENYGTEFGIEKGTFYKFTDKELFNADSLLFRQMEKYCIRDVDITHKIYLKYLRYLSNPEHKKSIDLEHNFQYLVNSLHKNGFSFNITEANILLTKVSKELSILDKDILKEFPAKTKLLKEVHPKVTKHGTLSKSDFRFVKDGDLSDYNGGPFSRFDWVEFNPSSHKQIVGVLAASGWSPTDKTQTHIDTERELQRLRYGKQETSGVDLGIQRAMLEDKLKQLAITGWRVNENNLDTLPAEAPKSARTLARRILLESRRRTLTEWLALVGHDDQRIHGKFYGIGAWTHRMAHQAPNTANIPSEFKEDGSPKLLGREMRSLWQAPPDRLLVGVDAEGIQLRIFAHYIQDTEFTDALVRGDKADKTDPHSLNQKVLGSICKTRQAAKRFIYALLLGAGLPKLAQILECSSDEAKQALDRLLDRYEGFARLKQTTIPEDARRGYFVGLDGRRVRIPGDTLGMRKHLCMSGYLQNGEAIVIKATAIKAMKKIEDEGLKDIILANIVHDEFVFEVPNNLVIAERVKKIVCDSIEEVGVELNLRCPLAGSGGIGKTWHSIH